MEPLARLGIELVKFDLQVFVDLAKSHEFKFGSRLRHGTQLDRSKDSDGMTEWKSAFIASLSAILGAEIFDTLHIKTNYVVGGKVHPKKLQITRLVDGKPILYVDSNRGRIEFAIPVLHHLALSGTNILVMQSRGPAVYHGKVPTVTIEVKSDDALKWMAELGDELTDAIRHFDDGLSPQIQRDFLRHLGAVYQDSNATKTQADGKCKVGPECPYCQRLQHC